MQFQSVTRAFGRSFCQSKFDHSGHPNIDISNSNDDSNINDDRNRNDEDCEKKIF